MAEAAATLSLQPQLRLPPFLINIFITSLATCWYFEFLEKIKQNPFLNPTNFRIRLFTMAPTKTPKRRKPDSTAVSILPHPSLGNGYAYSHNF